MSVMLYEALRQAEDHADREKAVACVKKMAAYLKGLPDLKFKETIMIFPRTMRTNYCRGEDLLKEVEAHHEEIEKIFRAFTVDLSNKAKIVDFLSG